MALRAVSPDEKAPIRNVAEAAASGSHRDLLVAMRDRIAKAVADTDCPPRDLAALTRRLQDIAKEIASIDARAADEAGDLNDTDDSFDASAI